MLIFFLNSKMCVCVCVCVVVVVVVVVVAAEKSVYSYRKSTTHGTP